MSRNNTMSDWPLQVIVEIRVVFLKIGEIDTLKEQYSADTFIQAKWREPLLDGKVPEVRTTPLPRRGTVQLSHVIATQR